MPSPQILPVASIQPTFCSVVDDVYSGTIPHEDIWISCFRMASPSLHTKVRVVLDEIDRNLIRYMPVNSHNTDVQLEQTGAYPNIGFAVSSTAYKLPKTRICVARQEYLDPNRTNPQHPHRITAFDVTPNSSQLATGYLDGSIHIYPILSLSERRFCSPQTITSGPSHTSRTHKSTVTSLQFFPSNKVLLSAGGDFQLNIFPADPLPPSQNATIAPVRTLSGHTRSVTSTAIIPPGRNILSSSTDGTVRLWDVSQGKQIASPAIGVPVSAMTIGEIGADPNTCSVYCGLGNGSFAHLDVRVPNADPKSTSQSTGEAIQAIAYSSAPRLLAAGSANGVVRLYDIRATNSELLTFQRGVGVESDYNGDGVTCLSFTENGSSLVITCTSGLSYAVETSTGASRITNEILGPDCYATQFARCRSGEGRELWTASDDGIVRRYSL